MLEFSLQDLIGEWTESQNIKIFQNFMLVLISKDRHQILEQFIGGSGGWVGCCQTSACSDRPLRHFFILWWRAFRQNSTKPTKNHKQPMQTSWYQANFAVYLWFSHGLYLRIKTKVQGSCLPPQIELSPVQPTNIHQPLSSWSMGTTMADFMQFSPPEAVRFHRKNDLELSLPVAWWESSSK